MRHNKINNLVMVLNLFVYYNENPFNYISIQSYFSLKLLKVFTFLQCAQSIPRLEKPNNCRFSHKNPKMSDFRFNTLISSLNQGQGSVFKVRECAQSIPRLEKPKNRRFSHKNPKMFDFRLNTPTIFPESGSRKRFHASGMRAIDSSHKITH
jgi:hypothetical protein